jgi:hypothetical protein
MATTKKTTTKKNTAKKAAPKDTGAMDEFLDTVVGETIQEKDIVPKKATTKNNKSDQPKVKDPVVPQPSVEEKNFFDKAFEKRWEDNDITKEMQDIIKNDVEQIGLEAAADIVDDDLPEITPDMQGQSGESRSFLSTTKVNRITAVTDISGNVVYYKVPSDCEELQNLENKDEIKKQIAKIIADDIYKKFNEEMAEKLEPVEVKPVDITPEVVAPKPVFPFRVVDKW